MPGAVGAAIVTSIYLSAHLVNVVARVGGFGREAIIVSAVLLAVATLVVASSAIAGWRRSAGRPAPASSCALWDDAAAWFLALAVGLIVVRRPVQQRLARDARTAGSAAAGTGATSSSTSRSARASRPATSRRRSPTSPASR